MPIRNLWFNYKLEGIEAFFTRAFSVDYEYIRPLDDPETEWEYDHALDIVWAYQDIVFRAVYSELNALVELELRSLARSILQKRGDRQGGKSRSPDRSKASSIIEEEYAIELEDLPGFGEVDAIRKTFNAYKHEDGFSGEYEEIVPEGGWLFGYHETRYALDWEKAHRSIQAVKEFMHALPGDRQEFPEIRYKVEDADTIQTRQNAWENLRKSGALGHILGSPMPMTDQAGGFEASCQLCGKSFQHDDGEVLPFWLWWIYVLVHLNVGGRHSDRLPGMVA